MKQNGSIRVESAGMNLAGFPNAYNADSPEENVQSNERMKISFEIVDSSRNGRGPLPLWVWSSEMMGRVIRRMPFWFFGLSECNEFDGFIVGYQKEKKHENKKLCRSRA